MKPSHPKPGELRFPAESHTVFESPAPAARSVGVLEKGEPCIVVSFVEGPDEWWILCRHGLGLSETQMIPLESPRFPGLVNIIRLT